MTATRALARKRDDLAAAEQAVDAARTARNRLVRRAVSLGVTKYQVAQLLGISPQAVAKIVAE